MRNCFYYAVVNIKSVLYNLFTVTCNGRRNYVDFGVDCIDFLKKAFDNLYGISF